MAKEVLKNIFVGMTMGIADLIPGTSGGTLALIAGVYPRLINALSALPNLLQISVWANLSTAESKRSIQKADFPFLIPVGLGMATSILLFSRVIKHFSENYPVILWAFFFGLILFSILGLFAPLIFSLPHVSLLCLGTMISLCINTFGSIDTTGNHIKLFFSGFLAISAMVLPGISGAMVLVILGEYHTMINALKDFDFLLIIVFLSGCTVGILVITRLLSWLVFRYKEAAIAFFCGFMLGSLPKLWPWQLPTKDISREFTPFFIVGKNTLLSPSDFHTYSGKEANLIWALLVILIAAAIFGIIHYQNKKLVVEVT